MATATSLPTMSEIENGIPGAWASSAKRNQLSSPLPSSWPPSALAQIMILSKSDRKEVSSRAFSPSVLLVILSAVAARCLQLARLDIVVISWSRKALRDRTLYDLVLGICDMSSMVKSWVIWGEVAWNWDFMRREIRGALVSKNFRSFTFRGTDGVVYAD
jgi:hypothetical protein